MLLPRQKIISLAVLVIAVSAVLAYFVKPKPPLLELVLPEQELANYEPRYPGDTTFSDRVIKSYQLALVLVQSPYTQGNVISLENIRRWARERFQSQPDFLHPAVLPVAKERPDTVFGAVGYNLFAGARYLLEEGAGEVLRFQIAAFHNTGAYVSFSNAYFDFFGDDADAAALLARYQSDRARLAVDVILWSVVWLGGLLASAVAVFSVKGRARVARLRVSLGVAWLLLGLTYFVTAWATNDIGSLLSATLSGAIGGYLLCPFVVAFHQEVGMRPVGIELRSQWVALAAWFSFSLIVIQVLTWIRGGLPSAPDPVTLLLSSCSGNFIHDPVGGKRIVTIAVAVSWVLAGLWAARQQKRDVIAQEEALASLSSLPTTRCLEHIEK